MGKRKGERVRPCHLCHVPVKFVFWKFRGDKVIYHWANADGSHHVHGNVGADIESYMADERQDQLDHINEILRGDE